MTNENDLYQMAFSPEQAPVYGGGTIVVAFSEETEFPSDSDIYLVFQGSSQRHVISATQVNDQTLHSLIPAHDTAETIQLQVYIRQDGNCRFLGARHFEYCFDTAHHLAWFLVDSVSHPRALDDLELVRSECFDLANEVLSTLDERLSKAFQHISLPEDWNLLGEDANHNGQASHDTLFHFCARLGLDHVAAFLLDKPGSDSALLVRNRHGYTPKDIAMENNYQGLTELLSEYNTQRSLTVQSQRVSFEDVGYYDTENGVTSLTTVHEQSQRTVEEDIESLTFIEQRVREKSLRDINRLHQREFETDWPIKQRSQSEPISSSTEEEFLQGENLNSPVSDYQKNIDLDLGLNSDSADEQSLTQSNDLSPEILTSTETFSSDVYKSEESHQDPNSLDEIEVSSSLKTSDSSQSDFLTSSENSESVDQGTNKSDSENPEVIDNSLSVNKNNFTEICSKESTSAENLTDDDQKALSDGLVEENKVVDQITEDPIVKDFQPAEDLPPNLVQEDDEDDSSNPPDPGEFTERLHISDDEDDDAVPQNDDIFVEDPFTFHEPAPLGSKPKSPLQCRMVEIPEEPVSPTESNFETSVVLEDSLRYLRGINSGLQKIRANKFHQVVLQEFRRENLQRFSSSCPSLDDNGRQSPLSPVTEEDYHKSMLDLIQEGEPTVGESLDDQSSDLGSSATIDPSHYDADPVREGVGTHESDVQIFVNDVTVDSSEDGPETVDDGSSLPEYEPLKRREPSRTSVRRRSWCPEVKSKMRNVVSDQRRDFKAEMLKSNGRSLSLSSLENGLASEEDDAFHDARENQTPNQSEISLSNQNMSQPIERDFSRSDSSPGPQNGGSSPEPDTHGFPTWGDQMRSERSLSSSSSVDTATRHSPQRKSADLPMVKMRAQTFGSTHGSSLDNDKKCTVNSLLVPHSSLKQKSRSTPSLPEAANGLKSRQGLQSNDSPKRKTRDKQANRPVSLQNVIAEFDAKIRRQEEVEEDEDESLNQFLKNEDKKSHISLTDFLSEQSYDSDEKIKSKDEKRRRPSVFSKFTRGSHRGRKSKDKEGKQKGQTHQFVSVSFSNSTSCYVCAKSLANKSAVRCESCMISVHENSCKDQIPACTKGKQQQKVPQRDGSSQQAPVVQPKEKASIFAPATSSLRHVTSFKEKRSASAPIRQQQPMGTGLNRSNTTPSSKAINEEKDNDSGPRPEQEASNIQDTLSVSLESLDDARGTSEFTDFDDPELMLTKAEAETWSVTVDKKTLKKLNAKDIKRQDTIWELIQTEIHYCRSLRLLQMMFAHGMLNELRMSQEIVDRLFPNLDDLIDMHMNFLRNLRQLQRQRADQSIESVGPALVEQFSGAIGDRMKAAYGRFCSLKEKSVQLYKDFLKNDRKFQNFIKRCNTNSLCQRREIPGFLLHISLRITKYPILIESILKTTKDKRDHQALSQALSLSKSLLEHVDAEIDAYQRQQRLLEIYNKLDTKATPSIKSEGFKKSDILSRKLLHEGVLSWKSARGKLVDVIVVVLSDVILFLQENNQKYIFFSQDNKSSVISLYKLLVREKEDARDSKGGIYMISQNKEGPEMYELVCKPTDKRETWMNIVRAAADNAVPSEIDEERKIQEARTAKLRDIIEQMDRKDQEIKRCCEEKNQLYTELLELNTKEYTPLGQHAQVEKVKQQEVGVVLQAAIQEASRLTVMFQSGNGGSNLSRSVSSVGEHVSASYMSPPVPKRAETFAGFDSHEQKVGMVKKRFPTHSGDDDGSISPVQRPNSNQSLTGSGEAINKDVGLSGKRPASQPSLTHQGPLGDRDEPDGRGSDPAIDRDTLGDLSFSALDISPPSREHVVSFAQLVQYLHTILHLTAQQGTAVESFRAQLAEANEKINKLSTEVNDRKNASHHNQLEELRNLQSTIRSEKDNMERQKHQMAQERVELDKEWSDLAAKKEEFRRQKEILQRQVDLSLQAVSEWKPNPTVTTPSSLGKVQSSSSFYVPSGITGDQISHKRSASAEYPNTGGSESNGGPANYGRHVSQPGGTGRDSMGRPMHRFSVASFSGTHGRSDVPANQQKVPAHLLSCTNEQKAGSVNAVPTTGNVQQVLPFKLASGASGPNASPVGTMPTTQSAPQLALPTHLAQPGYKSNPNSSSNLGQVMRNKSLLKLAEPGSAARSRTTSQPSLDKMNRPTSKDQHQKHQQPHVQGEIYF